MTQILLSLVAFGLVLAGVCLNVVVAFVLNGRSQRAAERAEAAAARSEAALARIQARLDQM